MHNELRYYLTMMLDCMTPETEDDDNVFVPSYIITATKLPTGAIEIAVNDKNIKEKLEYILDAYDEDMRLKTNQQVIMQNVMIV